MLVNHNSILKIEGLTYIPDFISEKEEKELIKEIDNSIWLTDLKRRVQHYGYKYDYKARRIDISMKIGELPLWTNKLTDSLEYIFKDKPDQLIINEYLPGQGISKHIDCTPCFTNVVVSLSLNSSCIMYFTDCIDQTLQVPYLLEPRSLVILQDEARYNWMHSIKPVKTDIYFEHKLERNRRISLTFRKTILI